MRPGRERLTGTQVAQLLEVAKAKDARLYPLWFVMARAGLRLGEALILRADAVQGKTLRVERSISSFNREEKETKGKEGRSIPMTSGLAAFLKRHVAQRKAEDLKLGKNGNAQNPLLFPSEANTPLQHNNVVKRWNRCC
jgi:integrase